MSEWMPGIGSEPELQRLGLFLQLFGGLLLAEVIFPKALSGWISGMSDKTRTWLGGNWQGIAYPAVLVWIIFGLYVDPLSLQDEPVMRIEWPWEPTLRLIDDPGAELKRMGVAMGVGALLAVIGVVAGAILLRLGLGLLRLLGAETRIRVAATVIAVALILVGFAAGYYATTMVEEVAPAAAGT